MIRLAQLTLLLSLAAASGPAPKLPHPSQSRVPASARVIDQSTQEPLPEVEVQIYRFEGNDEERNFEERQITGPDGVFTTIGHFSRGVIYARVLDGADVELGRVLWAHDPRDTEPKTLSVRVGPTYRLAIETEEAVPATDWRARLVEYNASDERRTWAWTDLRPGDPPYVRYPRAEYPTGGGWRARLEIIGRGLRWRGDAAVGTTEGIHAATITIVPRRLASLAGQATDGSGAALAQATMILVPSDPEALRTPELWPRATCDEEGSFRFEGVEPATYRLRSDRTGARAHALDVPPGETSLGAWVAAPVDPVAVGMPASADSEAPLLAGQVTGTTAGPVLLTVRAADASDEMTRFFLLGSALLDPDPLPFRISGLERGDYELSVTGTDGRTAFHPATLPVRFPATDLQFAAVEPAESWPLVLRARDAATGELLPEFLVQLRSRRGWTPEPIDVCGGELRLQVPAELELSWSIFTKQHRAARGTVRASADEAPQPIEPTLLPGYSARFYLRDARGRYDPDSWPEAIAAPDAFPALERVEAISRGFVLGQSGADGVLDLDVDEPPPQLEFRRANWHVFPSPFFRGGRPRGLGRDIVVWMHPDD